MAGTTEFVHIEQVSALFTFRLEQVLLYNDDSYISELNIHMQTDCGFIELLTLQPVLSIVLIL
jgi:hypothetical protein